jgi:general secretion pathway protein D
VTETESRVPLLGRIPLLGALFRSDSTKKNKTNLMVFIKPTILRDNVQAAFQTNAKYNYIRDQQMLLKPKNVRLMPQTQRTVLPEVPAAAPATDPESPVIDLREQPAGESVEPGGT